MAYVLAALGNGLSAAAVPIGLAVSITIQAVEKAVI